MAQPTKAAKPPLIDINDPDQVILLALSTLFAGIDIARGNPVNVAQRSVKIARELLADVVTEPTKPATP